MIRIVIVTGLLLISILSAEYAASDAGFAMSNLSAIAQSGESYATVPAVYTVFEAELVNVGPIIVLAKPLVSGDVSNWTNQPVRITLVNNNPATWNVLLQYRPEDSTQWSDYVGPFMVTGNSLLFVRTRQTTLNMSEEITVTINNIDTDIPQVTVTANPLDENKTKYRIGIFATDHTSGIKEIINPDGLSSPESTIAYDVAQSGVYNFSVADLAGNKVQYALAVTINQIQTFSAVTTATITQISRPLAYPTIFDPDHGNTRLYFELKEPASVAVRIYTIGGSLVNSMDVDGKEGVNYVEWTGTSNWRSDKLDSGVYLFYVLSKRSGKVHGRGKVIIMREK